MAFSRTRFGRRLFCAAVCWTLPVVCTLVAVGYLSAMDAALAEVRKVARADGRPAVRRVLAEMQTLQVYAWGALGLFSAAYLAVLLLARRLASLADELEHLTAFALHDARAPLVRITEDAKAVAEGRLAPRAGARAILEIGEARLKLIEDYTNIARDFAGFAAADAEEFCLAELAGCIADYIARTARHVRLVRDFPAGDLRVRAHRRLVGEIVGNLLDNAVKYTDTGQVRLALARERRGVRLVVADTGRGMGRDVQARMYERFYRADAARDRPGSGLGLATVRAAVRFYRGTIACDSAPGRGTVFTVRLPLKCPRPSPLLI